MTPDLRLLVASALLAWVMLMTGSTLRTRLWTWTGIRLAFGNRDVLPAELPIAGRADRAAANMLENLVLFAVLLLTAHAAGVAPSRLELPAQLFFWARLAYFPAYLAGVVYLRTALWFVGVTALGLIVLAMI
jgi:uncharacterized MAPEG superfamily protein